MNKSIYYLYIYPTAKQKVLCSDLTVNSEAATHDRVILISSERPQFELLIVCLPGKEHLSYKSYKSFSQLCLSSLRLHV